MRSVGPWMVVVALATGCDCGDNQASDVDAAVVDAAIDAAIDASEVRCAVPDIGAIGGFCAADEGCSTDGSGAGLEAACLSDDLAVPWPAGGFCTTFECASDGDCADGAVCGQLAFGSVTFGACLPACCDGVEVGDVCSNGRLCSDTMFGEEIGAAACVPATPGVGDGAPCATFGECDRDSTCRDDVFQQPGGQCAVLGCADDSDCAPGGDGRCVNLVEDQVGAVCVDDCESDADCRVGEGYRCVDHGGDLGRFCRHPAPGDDCAADADCGTGADNDPWVCRLDNATHDYPGGYCTVEACDPSDNNTCPIFSFCVELTGEGDTFCADECEMGSDSCGAGYECAQIDAPGPGPEFVCVPEGATVVSP